MAGDCARLVYERLAAEIGEAEVERRLRNIADAELREAALGAAQELCGGAPPWPELFRALRRAARRAQQRAAGAQRRVPATLASALHESLLAVLGDRGRAAEAAYLALEPLWDAGEAWAAYTPVSPWSLGHVLRALRLVPGGVLAEACRGGLAERLCAVSPTLHREAAAECLRGVEEACRGRSSR